MKVSQTILQLVAALRGLGVKIENLSSVALHNLIITTSPDHFTSSLSGERLENAQNIRMQVRVVQGLCFCSLRFHCFVAFLQPSSSSLLA